MTGMTAEKRKERAYLAKVRNANLNAGKAYKISDEAREQIEATISLDKIAQGYKCFLCGKESKHKMRFFWASAGNRKGTVCPKCYKDLKARKTSTGLNWGGVR